MNAILTCTLVVILSLSIPTSCPAQVITTFDFDLEGWLVTGDNNFIWQPAGGNPDGNLDVNDRVTGAHNYATAPPSYLGDWSTFTSADSLSYEVFFINTSGGSRSSGQYVFRIAGPGGSAWAIDAAATYPPQNIWTKFIVSLNPVDWTITAGTWEDILANVTSVRCNAEYVLGGEEVRIDNISLSSTPNIISIDCAYDDFNVAGTGDWTAQGTSGLSNPGSGGNAGGYLQIGDHASYQSYLFVPSLFLGDWSSYDGAGFLTLDLRLAVYSGTNLGAPEFIRISGPGGSAYVSLLPDDVPTGHYIWETFVFPIDEAAWTVDLGTWANLIANVTECKIDVEFYDASETVCIDNFGRMMNYCPVINDPVISNDPGVTICDRHSFVKIWSIAYNPMDGLLYGLIRDVTGSGGGLYPVMGDNRGIRMQAYDRPADVIFDYDGDAYISEDYAGRIYRLEWGGASSLWVTGFHSGDDDPFGMTIAPPGFNGPTVNEGDILVSDRGNGGADQIWSFSPDSAETEQLLMPDPGTVDQFDLTATAAETVYVCDALDSNNLYQLDSLGVLSTLPINTPVTNISSIVYDTVENDIYIAGRDDDSVYRVDPYTGNVTLIASGFVDIRTCCLEIHSPSRRLWVADFGLNRVYELCLSGATGIQQHAPSGTFALRVYPNPFNPTSRISFHIPTGSRVGIRIYNVTGALVKEYQPRWFEAGRNEVIWNGRDNNDNLLASGVYFVRVRSGRNSETTKLVLIQ